MPSANDWQVGGTHYKQSKIEHWDWSWASGHDLFQYCITKYVDRHKRKNGLEDLKKAQHYLQKYIELLSPPLQTSEETHEGQEYFNHRYLVGRQSMTSAQYIAYLHSLLDGNNQGEEPGPHYVKQD